MTTGTVLGKLEILKCAPGQEGAAWVQLRTDRGVLTALDPVGVQPGDTVLFLEGPGADSFDQQIRPDAVITAIVKGF